MNTTFSQTGGVRIGDGAFAALNVTWPFASLKVTESELTLSCFRKEWIFPKSSLRRLSRHDGHFSTGLRIEHGVETYASFIVFWSFQWPRLRRELELRGYVVS
jgi:hypothetical protein